MKPSPLENGNGLSDALAVKDLIFRYGKDAPIVLDIPEFSLKRGERMFLHGPSGSGKTTLLGLLAGILAPRSGSIRILDHDFVSMGGFARDRFRGAHFGYVFQMFNLIPYLSVRQNIELPLGISPERAARVGTDVYSATQALAEDLGIGALLDQKVTELSVGQQQRVAAARAFIGSPEIIVADEPTSALDTDHREAFLETMFRVAERCRACVLFVSHDHTLKSMFSRVVSLKEINRAAVR